MTDQEREIKRVISYIRSCRNAGIDTTITIDKSRNHFILNALEEIQQYQAIGTVEKCREAREKQREKKPILCMNEVSGMFVDYADGHGEYKTQTNNWFRCPCCNEVVGQRVVVHKHIHDQRKKKFCEKCGQAISWESDTP